MMGMQDKNMKNSIESKNYPKIKTLRELEKFDIDWYIVIKPSVPCSGRKSTSQKMSVDSIRSLTSTTGTQIESSHTKSLLMLITMVLTSLLFF